MRALEKSLVSKGFIVINHKYPSRKQTIEASAEDLAESIDACRKADATSINFVTHSLGGILVRQYFQTHQIAEPGRVVMLAPPNHGSEVVDHLKHWSLFQFLLGPAAVQLSTDPTSLPNRLAPIPLEIGIIAGTRSYDPWFSFFFDSPNDGKVTVESAQLKEMRDFITVDSGHSFIMNSKKSQNYIVKFLLMGHFSENEPHAS